MLGGWISKAAGAANDAADKAYSAAESAGVEVLKPGTHLMSK